MQSLISDFNDTTSIIVKNYLKEYISQTIDVQGSRDIMWNEETKSDLVLVYRKK